MSIQSINLDQVNLNIENIVSDIKGMLSDNNIPGINISDKQISTKELESACKLFGCGSDTTYSGGSK
jgi:hypothetical protein